MLKKYFLSNIAVLLVLNVLVKPVWVFFIDRNVQLSVGHEEYGMYSALVSLTIIFNILLDLGITSMNNRNLASDADEIHLTLPNMMVAKLLLSLLYFGILFSTALALQYSGRQLYLLLLLAGVQTLNSFLQYLRSNVSAKHDFKLDGLLSVLDKLLMIAACGFLLYTPLYRDRFQLEWFIYTQLGAYVLAILVGLLIIARRYTRVSFRHVSLSGMLSICRQSLPYALLILLMGVYMRSDSLMLERMEGATQNGLYAATYRILDIANMSGFLFAGILLPLFSRLIARKMPVQQIVETSTHILVSASLAFVAFCFVYGPALMKILYPADAHQLDVLFQLTIASFPAFCLMYIFATLITAHGQINLLLKLAGLGSLLSITLNYLLIARYHAVGAATASLIVEWTLAILYVLYAVRSSQLQLRLALLVKLGLLFGGIWLVAWFMHHGDVPLLAAALLSLLGFMLLVYLLGLWRNDLLRAYLTQFKTNR